MTIRNLKEKVSYCLEHYPITRNSDIELTTQIWKTYYPEYIKQYGINGQQFVYLNDLQVLPREDNVKRIRAKIQTEHIGRGLAKALGLQPRA